MGELILCTQPMAGVPYYMEQSSVNLYSIEELCYYFLNHTEYLDETYISEELCVWLEQELRMKELAANLRERRKRRATAAEMVGMILDSCGFATRDEKQQMRDALREMENKSELECAKIRADRSLKNHRYVMAIREYIRLLGTEDMRRADALMLGSIWNNIGVAHAGMFLYGDAAECFEKAYGYNNDPECLRQMQEAQRLAEQGILPVDEEDLSLEFRNVLLGIRQQTAMGNRDVAMRQWRQQLDKLKYIYENNSRYS